MYNVKSGKEKVRRARVRGNVSSNKGKGSLKGLRRLWDKSNIARCLLFEALYGPSAEKMMKMYPSKKKV